MKEYYGNITKEILEQIEKKCSFVYPIDFSKYDHIQINGDGKYIAVFKQWFEKKEILDENGEVMDWDYIEHYEERGFKKDSVSGNYVEY